MLSHGRLSILYKLFLNYSATVFDDNAVNNMYPVGYDSIVCIVSVAIE